LGILAPSLEFDSARARRRISWTAMSDLTQILNAIDQGDAHAAEQLLPLVYDELRRLAAEKKAQAKPGQTLQAARLAEA